MTEPNISDDGFWQFVDEEWVATEKQVLALENGARPHDVVDDIVEIDTVTIQKGNAISRIYSEMKPEHRMLSFIGICLTALSISIILILASLPIESNMTLPVTDCSKNKSCCI